MDDSTLEHLWKEFDKSKELQSTKIPENDPEDTFTCKQCNGVNLCQVESDIVCSDCGLIQRTVLCESIPYDTPIEQTKYKCNNHKLKRIQDWYMWSNEEKNTFKLVTYTKALCARLDLSEHTIPVICNTVVKVMEIIKKHEGTKRAKVKDGIILNCIQYVSNNNYNKITAQELARRINLDMKYITKAEKIILELTNANHLDINMITVVRKPFDYVEDVLKRKNVKISSELVNKVRQLILLCEQNDILLDHTPLSIGVSCFYYILKQNSYDIDTKLFSELYDLSIVTVTKTYNKLREYESFINTHLS
jgi:transcription initiation factor TFIIIB Brf1 subunit/transcription initiation factor TFIIB